MVYNALVPENDTVNYEVFARSWDGQKIINLTQNPAVDWVCHGWKNKIYFISDRDTTGGIYFLYRYDLNNQAVTRMDQHRMANSWLDSRNDGAELVICRQMGDFRSFAIIDSTGYEVREILRTNQYEISDPAFSPDGKWIVYRSTRSGVDELWIADELGSHQRQITHYPPNLEDPGTDFYHAGPPRWKPGTNIISYTSRRGNQYHIFSINADGTQNIQLTRDPGNQGWHSWSLDGKYLIYDGDKGNNSPVDLFLLKMENQHLEQMTKTPFPERAPFFLEYHLLPLS
ncbi:MAG: PD40 domain-containing protein [Saprospiraceae bacterium]|nr:PD40 domain-containing protein [Saprospiraceae bacterium]